MYKFFSIFLVYRQQNRHIQNSGTHKIIFFFNINPQLIEDKELIVGTIRVKK